MSYPGTPAPDFRMQVALGKVDATRVVGLGYNPSIDTGTVPEDIWTNGGVYPWPTGATMFEIGYLTGGDVGRVIRVSGIDFVTKAAITEDVVTNGLTFVALTKPFYRINSVRNMSPGVNPNDLILRRVTGGIVQAIVPAGIGVTQQSQYTAPKGYRLLIFSIETTINADAGTTSRSADVVTWFQSPTGVVTLPRRITVRNGPPNVLDAFTTIPVDSETDFQLRCINASANATQITGAWEGILFRL